MVSGAIVGVAYAPAAAGDKAPYIRLAQAATPGSATPQASSPFTAEQKGAIEKIIKDYLLANPEVMMDVQNALEAKMETLQAERLKLTLKESANEIFRRPNAPTAGNPNGDITVVEFFDYNCGYCKRAFGDIAKLVDKDPKVKVVFKELPILSKGSEEAARVALAARLQGKYWEVHRTLIGLRGEVNEASALRAVEKAGGLDMAKLKKDMDAPEVKAEIETVRNLAQKMGINGTPHFLVGDRAIAGAPQNLLEVISGHVAELRKAGCSVC
ncbi:MAG: DsbA family protein [Rhodospirillales bacterium]|nr:DsbA family protein [Rhodospirillales bacterium]